MKCGVARNLKGQLPCLSSPTSRLFHLNSNPTSLSKKKNIDKLRGRIEGYSPCGFGEFLYVATAVLVSPARSLVLVTSDGQTGSWEWSVTLGDS